MDSQSLWANLSKPELADLQENAVRPTILNWHILVVASHYWLLSDVSVLSIIFLHMGSFLILWTIMLINPKTFEQWEYFRNQNNPYFIELVAVKPLTVLCQTAVVVQNVQLLREQKRLFCSSCEGKLSV